MKNTQRYVRLAQAGDCKMALRSDDHDGWLLLDGRTIQANTYPLLFKALGITTATYTLPNFAGRVPMGASAEFPMGSAGGSSEVTLTLANIPEHSHPYTDTASEPKPGTAGLLGSVINILTGVTSKNESKTTGKTGTGQAVKLPAPPHVGVGYFVFSGNAAAAQ